MKRAIFRAIFTIFGADATLMGYLGRTPYSSTVEKLEKILPRVPSDYLTPAPEKLPRIIIFTFFTGRKNYSVPILDEKRFRIEIQSSDETGITNEKVLGRIRTLLDEQTPQILETDNVSYWDCFRWESDGVPSTLHTDVYSDFQDYSISIAPAINNRIGA
uniref:Tail protein n=1 Tax=viral metagenome TaxID=1070528 RepID=A0A6M3IGJ3_9ZZZZ